MSKDKDIETNEGEEYEPSEDLELQKADTSEIIKGDIGDSAEIEIPDIDDVSDTSGARGNIGISDTQASDMMRDDYRDFHEGILENAEEIERYDLGLSAEAVILFNPYVNEYLYRVVEPEMNEREERLRIRVSTDIREEFENLPVEEMSPPEMKDAAEELARDHLERQKTILGTYGNDTLEAVDEYTNKMSEYAPESLSDSFEEVAKEKEFDKITDENIEKIVYYIVRDYAEYEKLTPIMKDENIEDVSCNGPDVPIFLYHSEYQDVISNVMYEKEELDQFVAALAQKSEKNISIAEPDMQGRLPDGSRVQLTYSDEISDEGSNFTIRLFEDEPFTPIDLIEFDTFSKQQMAYLWLAIENEKSLIFAGGTASGKTTSMNAISLFIPPRSKVVSIEDTREITLRHSNWIKSVTRESFGSDESGAVDMYDLLRDALRQRPEYIIVGEIRGAEAQTLFQAMSTGHTTYSTMHADDVTSAIRRLENDPINLPRQMLTSLDILSVQVRKIDDGDAIRRCKEMVEIIDVKSETNEIKSQTVFDYNNKTDHIDFMGDSNVMDEIRVLNNWTEEELEEEIDRRVRALDYLIENVDVRDYEIIAGVLRSYMQDKELIMEQIENGELLKGQ
jgi:flagellar protein FlaI